jgi:hypothetical protein
MLRTNMNQKWKNRNLYKSGTNRFLGMIFIILVIVIAISISKKPPARTNASTLPAVGFNWHAGWSDYSDADNKAIVDKMVAAHMQWARIDIGWCSVEETGPVTVANWYVNKLDTAINYANSKGVKILGVYWCTPGWANGNQSNATPPTDLNQYGRSLQWVAAHWQGKVQAWEIWNEPDPTQSFWSGTTEQYASLLKVAYPKVKAGSPSAQVVFGAPSSNYDTWIDQVYSYGTKDYFDVMATHPYQGVANAPPNYPDDGNRWWFTHLPAVRNVMLKYNDGAKKIWFTEFGWSSHANDSSTPNWWLGVTPQQQGDYFVQSIQYVMANYPYVDNMIWYNERSRTDADIQNNNYGLLNYDLSPKPAYTTISQYLASVNTTHTGDVNGDGVVNITDLSILISNYNTNYAPADFNKDNIVNILDLSTLLSNYGK